MSKINVDVTGQTMGDISVTGDTNKKYKITISIGSIVVIGIILFLIFSNTKTGIEKDIVAKWRNREENDIFFIFTEDNCATLQDGNMYIDGTYSFISENAIVIDMNYSDISFSLTCDINIQHDILTLSNIKESQNILGANGMTLTFDLVE